MNRSETVIHNRREELPRVVEAVARFASRCRVADDVTKDLQVALDEILANIVDYAYRDNALHSILICLEMDSGMLVATIEDDGIAFNPLESGAPDLETPLRERRIGGLGIHFVKHLMHEVTYDRVGGRNRLVLKKKLAM